MPDDEVATRRERLRAALAGFDAATIVTTHQFCQYVLTGLGIAGDGDADVELVESLDDLVVEVVDDLYVRAFAGSRSGEPIFDRDTALSLARKVIDDPQATLVPAAEEPGTPAARRVAFGAAVRAEVDRRKRQRRILGYDDLLTRLATALEPEDAAARDRMRARWSIVLVDEFQDTDPVQWQILERAFAGHATVVLVGDPKQSIYAFRGGDIDTYLAAAQTAGAHPTLNNNWRADAPLVDALQVLLGEMALGSQDIRVRPVSAVTEKSRLVGAPVQCAAAAAGGAARRLRDRPEREDPDRPGAQVRRPRPDRGRRRPAELRRELRRPPDRGRGRRGDRRDAPAGEPGAGEPHRGGHSGGGRRECQRVPHQGG